MNELVEELSQAMLPHKMFEIFGLPIYDTIVTMWLVMAVLIVAAYVLGRNLQMVPSNISSP